MGVPKFFRFLSERYPLLNQPVKLRGAPEIDNLFLDLNGVVHNASHGAGTDMNTRMTEARSPSPSQRPLRTPASTQLLV